MRLYTYKILLTIFCGLTIISGTAQNIVPNNGFENYSSLPSGYGEWYKINGWSDLNGYIGFVWPYASPDFLHSSGAAGVDIPINIFANVNAFAGNAILGFTAWHGTTPAFREYAAIQFSTPMVVGVTYDVSMWITNGYSTWYCGAGCNHVGMGFSLSLPYQMDHEPIGGVPQCEYPGEIWNTAWQFISFTYTADQAYNYITIGNYYDDLSTSHTTHAVTMANAAYYFIDEVVVMPAGALPVTLDDFYAKENDWDINLFWDTKSEINNDYFIIEKSANGFLFNQIGMQDAAGYSTELLNYEFTDENPYSGINYYRLGSVDFNGEINYSDVIEIEMMQPADLFTLSPNPCDNVINIQLFDQSAPFTLTIYDIQGRALYYTQTTDGVAEIDVKDFAPGIYFVQVNFGNTTAVKKVMII